MNRDQITEQLSQYFAVHELVDELTYNKYGNESWQFFDKDFLHVLLIIREGIGKPIEINDWKWGGYNSQRGLRTNLCGITQQKTRNDKLYLSGHMLGKAADLKIKGMNADDARQWIIDNQDLFPCKVRLEHKIKSTGKTITWVHIDTKYLKRNHQVYLFEV